MKRSHYPVRRSLVIAGLACLVVVLAGASVVSAALTFGPTGISGDSSIVIDAPGIISIGTSSATGITIGNPNAAITIPGSVTISATTTLQNLTAAGLTISGLLSSSTQCLHANASGVVSGTGSDCGSGSGSTTISGTPFYIPLYNSAGNGLTGTSSIFEASSTKNIGIQTTTPAYAFTNASTTYTKDLITGTGPVVDIRSWGAIPNGVTDDSAAIQAAINAAVPNEVLLFPCVNSNDYIVDTPLSFYNKQGLTLEGSSVGNASANCRIDYMGPATTTAFSFIDAAYMNLYNISFVANNSSSPPLTVMDLGHNPAGYTSGGNVFDNLFVSGYAQDAVVYSIADEVNVWYTPNLKLLGGGAKYVYFTSSQDELGLGGIASSTNLSNYFYSPVMVDYSPTITNTHSLVYIGMTPSGTLGQGNDTFENGYFVAAPNGVQGNAVSSAFTFGWPYGSGTTGPLAIAINNIRAEDLTSFINIMATSTELRNLTVTDNTLAADTTNVSTTFINMPSNDTLEDSYIGGNLNEIGTGDSSVSDYGNLISTYVGDDIPISVLGNATGSYIWGMNGPAGATGYIDFNSTSTTTGFNVGTNAAISGTLNVGSTITGAGSVVIGAASGYAWTGRNDVLAPTNGTLEFTLFGQAANFNGFQFATTSATGLEMTTATGTQTFGFRNGNNTADANMTAASGTFSGNVNIGGTDRSGSSGAPGCFETYDALNTTTLDYAYASNVTWVVTTTKPSFCE